MHKKNYYTKIFYSSLSTRFCCKWSSEKDFKLISVFYLYYFCYETNFSIHFCLLYFCRWNCRVRSKKKEFSGLKLLCWKSWSRKAPLRFSLKYLLSKFVRYHSVSSLAIHKSFLAMDQAFVKKKKKSIFIDASRMISICSIDIPGKSWKGPARNTESNSCLYSRPHKN